MKKRTMLTIELTTEAKKKEDIYVFESTSETNTVFESRAKDLANILIYDNENYQDVNIETLIHAAELAGIIKNKTGE